MSTWSRSSWRDFKIKQQPTYNDMEKLREVEDELGNSRHLYLQVKLEN